MSTSLSRSLVLLFVPMLLLSGCGGDSSSSSSGTADGPTDTVAGTSQKGPYLKGSMVRADEVLDGGQLGSDSRSVETVDNRGKFVFDGLPWSGPTRLRIDGLFFDEFTGTVSPEQRYLDALVSGSVNDANINLYTHMVAGRVLSLMGDGEDFAVAQSQAQSEWQAIAGTQSPAHELDLLNASSGQAETDSANLLLFSAAVLKEGMTQSGVDAIRADFADDGLINGEGQARYDDVRMAASETDLLEKARGNLQSEFNVEPPGSGGSSGFAWLIDPCTSAALSEPRVLCEDVSFSGTGPDDSGEFVTFVPLVTGHYTIELVGDPEADNANAGACSWRLYSDADTSSTEVGSSAADGSFCGVEDVTVFSLNAGTRYFVRPLVSKDDADGPPARFRLSATRVTEGKEMTSGAMKIPLNEPVSAVVGTLISSTTDSFYRFIAGQGVHTISAGGFPCASGGAMRLELYEDGFSSRIARDWEDGKCTQTIEMSLEAGTEYYLKVDNWLGSWNRTSSRPAPGRITYTLEVSTQ